MTPKQLVDWLSAQEALLGTPRLFKCPVCSIEYHLRVEDIKHVIARDQITVGSMLHAHGSCGHEIYSVVFTADDA